MTKRNISGYYISGDPDEVDSKDNVAVSLRERLHSYYLMAQKGRPRDIPKLIKAIQKYPKVPQLKNYLSTLYTIIGNLEKAYSVNKWMAKEHPDYLFGKINLANQYLQEKKYDEIPNILGKDMELKSLYPERQVFHTQEFEAFYQIATMYFIAIDDEEQYMTRLDILKEAHSDPLVFKTIESFKTELIVEKALERMTDVNPSIKRVKTQEQRRTDVKKAPEFTHDIIHKLYHYDHRISADVIDQVLALPKKSLVQDLHLVIEDSIVRYAYFDQQFEESDGAFNNCEFLAHALFILGELEDVQSLPPIFKMLSQSSEYLQFYFGDMITEIVWEPLFKISKDHPKELQSFLFEPNIDTYAKSAVLDALTQIPLHFPSKRGSIQQIFQELCNFFLVEDLDENVFDSTFIAFLTTNISELQFFELLPYIKKLYKYERVDLSVSGSFTDFQELWDEESGFSYKRKVYDIKTRYENIVRTWAGYTVPPNFPKEESVPTLSEIWDKKHAQTNKNDPKIGRNDPCPCGSGKKFKKCCWGKV